MKLSLKNIPEKYWVLGDQIVVSGAAFCTNLLLARALGLVNYGEFSAVVMVQLFLLSITMVCSSQIYQVVHPSLEKQEQKIFTDGMLSQQIIISLSIFFMVLLFSTLNIYFHLDWLQKYQPIVLLAGIATSFSLLQDFLRKAFITQSKARIAFKIDFITNSLQILALVALWWYNDLNQFWSWLIIGFSFTPSVITGIVLLKPTHINIIAIKFCWKHQKDKIGWLIGSSLLQWGSGYFFVIAAGWWLGAAALGVLRLVQYLFGLLNLLLQAIENYALPKLAGHSGDRKLYWLQLMKKCLIIILPFLLLFSVFAKQLLRLTGGLEYEKYAFMVYGLSIIYLIMTIGYPVRIAIRSLYLNKDYFIAYILSVGFSLISAPWLLQNWGLYGVLSGLLFTQLITLGYWLIILQIKHSFLWKSFI